MSTNVAGGASLAAIQEALGAGAIRLLLDNMTPGELRAAVVHVAGRATLEASGGVTLETVRDVAATGVQFVSVGALTHSAPALDLSLKLEPLRFSGTMAVFFTVVNLSKWIPYWHLGLIDLTNLGTSLALGPVVLAGVWTGVRLATRIQPTAFYQLVMAGMVLSGGKLLWDALR